MGNVGRLTMLKNCIKQCSFHFTTLDALGREHLLQLTAARVRLRRSTVGVIEERLRSIISELSATDTAISIRKFLLNDNRYYIWGKPTKLQLLLAFRESNQYTPTILLQSINIRVSKKDNFHTFLYQPQVNDKP